MSTKTLLQKKKPRKRWGLSVDIFKVYVLT
nr:MAG TPA: hypothetical protein [Caudoviricetes sp.]